MYWRGRYKGDKIIYLYTPFTTALLSMTIDQ